MLFLVVDLYRDYVVDVDVFNEKDDVECFQGCGISLSMTKLDVDISTCTTKLICNRSFAANDEYYC